MKRLSVVLIVCLCLSGCATPATPTPAPLPAATATQPPAPPAAATQPPVATAVPQSTAPAPVRTIFPAPTSPMKATLVATEISPEGFVTEWMLDSWFDNPNPPMGSRVHFSGSLIRNGTWSGGDMFAEWVQGGKLQECSVIMIYQRGICSIPVVDFEPGVYVPITYTVLFRGQYFTGYNGFTPTLKLP